MADEADKRRSERVAANFAVSFRELGDDEAEKLSESKSLGAGPEAPAQPASAHTENISDGGISLTGDLELLGSHHMERGKKLLVEFRLPGEPKPVSAVAVVAWSIEGKGPRSKFTAGLMFTGIEPEDLDKIQRYVAGHREGG